MALFPDPFDTLLTLQQALDSFRSSGWLGSGPSSSGSYPPMTLMQINVVGVATYCDLCATFFVDACASCSPRTCHRGEPQSAIRRCDDTR
jgi:hypothetical protein